MVYTVEPHSAEALAVLQNLASLNLLTLKPLNGNAAISSVSNIPATGSNQEVPPLKDDPRPTTQNQNKPAIKPAKKAAVTLREKSLAGSISAETAQKMREHLEIVRNEWEHRI